MVSSLLLLGSGPQIPSISESLMYAKKQAMPFLLFGKVTVFVWFYDPIVGILSLNAGRIYKRELFDKPCTRLIPTLEVRRF